MILGIQILGIIFGLFMTYFTFLHYKRKEFKELGLSYEKMKEGFNNIINRFPETSYYYSRFCLIASIYEDKETARKLFDIIGNDLNRSAWGGEDVFNWYRRWAYE